MITKETNEANQRLVNEAWKHINTTRKKSMDEDGDGCIYAGSGCAFSPAIKPEFIDAVDEPSISAYVLLLEYPGFLHDWAKDADPYFASAIQAAHDNTLIDDGDEFISDFKKRIADSCLQFDVVPPWL